MTEASCVWHSVGMCVCSVNCKITNWDWYKIQQTDVTWYNAFHGEEQSNQTIKIAGIKLIAQSSLYVKNVWSIRE